MILYFSATGNCRFVAETIAKKTSDKAVSIQSAGSEIVLNDGENLGFVTPTYFWRLPSIVEDFLKNLKIKGGVNSYFYFIATYGTTTGQSAHYYAKYLKKTGHKLNASFKIKMPDTWTVYFDLSDKEELEKQHRDELPQIEAIVLRINHREEGDFINTDTPMIGAMGAKVAYNNARKTKHLHVDTKACIGCSLCERNCPVSAIKMEEGHPVWVKKRCTMCLQCLHKCPKFAIQYDDKTQNHGQYTHPSNKEEDI